MFAGNTILGDGSVIMIIEPNGIAGVDRQRGHRARRRRGRARADQADDDFGDESMLVFRAGSPQTRAVLSLVTRLEEVDVAKIETSNGRSLVQYRGQLDAAHSGQRRCAPQDHRQAAAPGVLPTKVAR